MPGAESERATWPGEGEGSTSKEPPLATRTLQGATDSFEALVPGSGPPRPDPGTRGLWGTTQRRAGRQRKLVLMRPTGTDLPPNREKTLVSNDCFGFSRPVQTFPATQRTCLPSSSDGHRICRPRRLLVNGGTPPAHVRRTTKALLAVSANRAWLRNGHHIPRLHARRLTLTVTVRMCRITECG